VNRCTLRAALLAAGLLVFASWALPVGAQVTAVLTADNHYGLYHGTADADAWTFIGRNEMGSQGDPGTYNWSLPETFDFDAFSDHHLYVVAWDEDGGGPAMWVGQFNLPDGTRIVSDTTSWECICGSGPSPRSGDVPQDDLLIGDVLAGGFVPPLWSVPNGSDPWAAVGGGPIPDVGDDASFIWTEDSLSPDGCGDHYVIFRTVDPIGSGSRRFVRGDCDADGTVNLTDPVYLLTRLFLGGPDLPCESSGDSDDSGVLDLSDAVFILQYLVLGGPPPPPPAGRCGVDPTQDTLPCVSFPACP
jgi:hypothetical protein